MNVYSFKNLAIFTNLKATVRFYSQLSEFLSHFELL